MAKNKGQFQPGNAGGPGRPPRATEFVYLRAFNESLTVEDWEAIVRRAVKDAKAGDGKARDWLTRYALGNEPPSLAELPLRELLVNGLTDV